MNATQPIALTIAGSDSGGGAGIQADLQTFARLGVHGTTAITCLTAQNPKRVLSVEPASPRLVRQQIEAVLAELPPVAVKTGMLYSRAIIEVVARQFTSGRQPPLIVDPVMIATSGAPLLRDDAVVTLKKRLLPRAALVTPNVDELSFLLGRRIREPEELREAAHQLHSDYGCAVLAKGGHLRNLREAIDVFWDGRTELLLSAPFTRGVSTHGTGCTYSAAITAYLAQGLALPKAVKEAKEFISTAIAKSARVGRHRVLNWKIAGEAAR